MELETAVRVERRVRVHDGTHVLIPTHLHMQYATPLPSTASHTTASSGSLKRERVAGERKASSLELKGRVMHVLEVDL